MGERPILHSEAAVVAALRERHPSQAWAFLSHVRNGTGYARRTARTADALAFSLWPSRGLELHGFEVKVSRGDWKRELEDPAKAEAIQAYCDRWWVAVGDEAIVQPGELPATWGLLEPGKGKGGLVVKVEAPKLEAQPLDRLMLAAILRRVAEDWSGSASQQQIAAAVEAERKRNEAGWAEREEKIRAAARVELDSLKADVEQFEAQAGIRVLGYQWHLSGRTPGQALRWWLDGGEASSRNALESLRAKAKSVLSGIEHALDEEASNG